MMNDVYGASSLCAHRTNEGVFHGSIHRAGPLYGGGRQFGITIHENISDLFNSECRIRIWQTNSEVPKVSFKTLHLNHWQSPPHLLPALLLAHRVLDHSQSRHRH